MIQVRSVLPYRLPHQTASGWIVADVFALTVSNVCAMGGAFLINTVILTATATATPLPLLMQFFIALR